MGTKLTMNNVSHAIASDLVREYIMARDNPLELTVGVCNPEFTQGYRAAIRAVAIRMGVYPLFNESLAEEDKN